MFYIRLGEHQENTARRTLANPLLKFYIPPSALNKHKKIHMHFNYLYAKMGSYKYPTTSEK
jgi:hypothetical protein